MNRLLKILLILLSINIMTGCSGVAEKFSLLNLRLDPLGSSGLTLHTQIENASRHTLRIPKAEILLYEGEALIGWAELRGEIVIPKRAISEQASRWKLHTDNPFELLRLGKMIPKGGVERFTVAYRITVRSGLIKKTFSNEMVPLSDFLRTFRP